MLVQITDHVWSIQHSFVKNMVVVSSRMTVIELLDRKLWVHSPVPVSKETRRTLQNIGEVSYVIAPSKSHTLFFDEFTDYFPECSKFVAEGLEKSSCWINKVVLLDDSHHGPWHPHLEFFTFRGIPAGNETVWFHNKSSTLILTDLCQCWNGKLRLSALVYSRCNGVNNRLAVPTLVKWLVTDKRAAAASAQRILQWPVQRIVLGHNCIIEKNALEQLQEALEVFNY
ncbi:MAG: DUF4336 domain-containing protein [Granulosicoccus sp.]|nr:DUF4336 domain-containing protein [Granulosicoccus sp.]